jgi:heavy metal sensor kinase
MKSIRLSLLLYFLVLLAVALGAISAWAYQHTRRILDANVVTQGNFLRTQCAEDCRRVDAKFNDALYQKARYLAQQAQIQHHMRMKLPEIQFREDVLLASSEHHDVTEYFQINSERGGIAWHSPSMGDRWLSYDPEEFKKMELSYPEVNNTELQPGSPLLGAYAVIGLVARGQAPGPLFAAAALDQKTSRPGPAVRRVMLKALAAWRVWMPRPSNLERPPVFSRQADRTRGAGNPDATNRLPPPLEPREVPSAPTLYIQCAAETIGRDRKVEALRNQLERDLANLNEDSRTTLSTLRDRLLMIDLATFAATVVGGVWLVRLGLSPLQRLSEAVSRVSAKDFRLPFDEPRLPRELRPIVDRLTQTLELLKRTFAREKQAAADISHELRTPLAALLTTTEVALRKPRSAEEYRELLADCHATGQQMSQLIERLLALARLDAGVDTLRPREVDASNVAEQCASLVRPLVAARGLTLHVKRNGPVMLNTDPDKLREVVTNLLHNAIEYNRPEGSIELVLERQNGHVFVEVRDTGIGIAPEAREHIFERFYRADPSRQSDGLHAGLGLSIVKGYIDLMDGKISVESTEGQGTTFRVELPAR